MVKVFIEKENKNIDLDFKGSVIELLDKLKINSETVLILSSGEVLTENEKLEGSEEIKIISVVSGG